MGLDTRIDNNPVGTSDARLDLPLKGWSFKYLTAAAVVFSMLLLAVAVIGVGWLGARDSLLTAAAKT
ncbi:MAG: hypothetical protein ABL931_17790, partial [Usitatibacteraceae bacterium]